MCKKTFFFSSEVKYQIEFFRVNVYARYIRGNIRIQHAVFIPIYAGKFKLKLDSILGFFLFSHKINFIQLPM